MSNILESVVDTSTATFGRAKKTRPIQAKPLSSVLVDASVISKFLIGTLEGKEPVTIANLLCVGEVGEPWQQSPKALLKKYDITNITAEGWLVCTPKPENEVEFYFADKAGYIVGLWGETIDGVANLQAVAVGDAIARQTYDYNDQWVVRRNLFDATYSVL